jgi:capsular exopolysaccharide synthesis family protein
MFDTHDVPAAVPADVPGTQPLSLPTQGPESVHILDRLNAVFKHRRLAGTAFVLVVAVMMIQTYSTVPMYETRARVLIEDEKTTNLSNLNPPEALIYQDPLEYKKTQFSILQSRALAKRVVDRMGLSQSSVLTGAGPRPRDPISLIRDARSAASTWLRSLVSKPARTEAPKPLPEENASQSAAISALLAGVSVQPETDTRLVWVVYRHSNPQFAAAAANALVDEYAAQNLEMRVLNIQKLLTWVRAEVDKQGKLLADSEAAMATYRNVNDAISLENSQNIVGQRLTTLNDAALRAASARSLAETAFNQVRNADPNDDSADNFPAIGNSERVVNAKTALRSAQEKVRGLEASGFGAEYQPLKAARIEVDGRRSALVAARRSVIESLRNDYNAALINERNVQAQLQQAKAGQMDIDRKSVDYNKLQREANSTRDVYNALLTQEKQLTVVANSKQNNVSVIERAEVPKFPFAPNPRREWLSAIAAGIIVAFGLAFGIEYLDDSVKTPEDITRRLKVPLLGLVPAIHGDRVPVLSEVVPHDFGEAFRSLRTSLVFTSGSEHTRVIAVTSSQPLEGKTTTAANLALALALGGSRVLLIDADMRRPGLHKTLGIQNGTGLSQLLTGQARVRDAIQRTAEQNLLVITAGRTPPNPSELLASERMASFIHNLQNGPFDWVIIDTPPVLAVTDAVILATKVSGLVFVIGSEMTRCVHAERALETIRSSRPRALTAVLNRVDFDRNKYYYSRYYGYQYKSYYGQHQSQGAA